MGSNADFMENDLKPKKYAYPCCPAHPCWTKNGPETSITPTILHHILHALFFYRKIKWWSPWWDHMRTGQLMHEQSKTSPSRSIFNQIIWKDQYVQFFTLSSNLAFVFSISPLPDWRFNNLRKSILCDFFESPGASGVPRLSPDAFFNIEGLGLFFPP